MMLASYIVSALLVLVCSSSSTAAIGENYTYVSQAGGKDEPVCIRGGVQHPCLTLLYVANYTNNESPVSMNIRVQGPTLLINDSITFSHAMDITLEGSSTVLRCNCKNCGFMFEYSRNITIRSLRFTGCGVKRVLFNYTFRAAVLVYACYNFSIEESNFTANNGTGLSTVDTYGSVKISNSNFEGNSMCNCTDARGLRIVFNSLSMSMNDGLTTQDSMTNYTIENCHIQNNRYEQAYEYKNISTGGGISVLFAGDSTGNTVTLTDVVLKANLATWGGGMTVLFSKNATNNKVFLNTVNFSNNDASQHGGGLNIGYIDSTSDPPITNIVNIDNCTFTHNHARSGGGTAIFASHTTCGKKDNHSDDALVFRSCVWEGNTGYFSSAIDISPFSYDTLGDLYFPHPKFVECSFVANYAHPFERQYDYYSSFEEQYKVYQMVNIGSFVVYGFEVLFDKWVEFRDHNSTALHVTDGTATFLPHTNAYYYNNSGYQGGALAMFGSSLLLLLLPKTTLMFINNSAFTAGGAIYHSTQNPHDFISSRTCFIKSGNRTPLADEERPVLFFRKNHVGHVDRSGQSIFATTFLPCYFEQFQNAWLYEHTMLEALRKIAEFDFGEEDENTALATTGISFDLSKLIKRNLSVIPGNHVIIPLTMKDELNNTVPSVYRVVSNDACQIDRHYMLDRIGIKAMENTMCNLELIAVSFRELSFKVKISVMNCPPGFYLKNETCTCTCSAYSKEHAYFGISTCHDQKSFAYVKNGFWVGYDDDGKSLLTSLCPSSFCRTNMDRDVNGIKLPNMSSSAELYKVICHPHRTGWLCGTCHSNYAVYYHSPTYQCGPQRLCACGLPFYFLSEIVPIVIMFSVIALFDIRFTTGTASSLVFFAQIINVVTLDMKWNSDPPKLIAILSIFYKVVYGLFNFEFFNFEQASYCLWKNATVLDVIAFKYVSVVFAFVLLLMIVLFLKYCTLNCLQIKLNSTRVGKNRSIIHSMSAVLVMCYAQCTNISLQILAKATLRGAGRKPIHDVTLFGGVYYFQKDHLIYALAACVWLSTIIVVPPVLLLVYPSYLNVFSFCKLKENHPAHRISKLFVKFKPFFDSFQGCYRDKLRFFSALFFVSRVVILAVNAFNPTTSQSIIITEIVVLLILGMYALFHPFRKAVDNINTGLILLNMSVIGCLTILAYSQAGYDDQRHMVIFALIVRLILLYLPIIFVCSYVIKRAAYRLFIIRFKKWRKKHETRDNTSKNPREVDPHSYVPYQEVTINSSEPAPDNDLSYSYRSREDLLLSV